MTSFFQGVLSDKFLGACYIFIHHRQCQTAPVGALLCFTSLLFCPQWCSQGRVHFQDM